MSFLWLILALAAVTTWTVVARGIDDKDADGMDDGFEAFFGLDPTTNDAALDADNDGLANIVESFIWTDPFVADTDRDGIPDGIDTSPVDRAVIRTAYPKR
jgi:hypothetical protein